MGETVLLLASDQQAGIAAVDGHEVPVRVTHGIETLVCSARDLLVIVAHDGRRIAVAAGNRPDDSVFSVPKIPFSQ